MQASVQLLRNLTLAVAELGCDPALVLGEASLSWKDLETGDGEERRVPVEVLRRFWTAAVSVTGDPSIGVRVGARARLEHFGVLGEVLRGSATLGDALLRTGRYMRLWIESTRLSLLVEGEQGQVFCRSDAPEPHPSALQSLLATLLVLSRELTGLELVPNRVRIASPAPEDDSVFRDVFGVAPTFDEGESALVFPSDVLMLPVAARGARAQPSAASPGAALSRRVRDVLAAELQGGNPMIENVAAQLGIHPKTLTRRLKQEGTSHSELLDSLRRELAEQHLSASTLNVTEVAFLLGFSDASAFNKAFRRWFGVGPLAFRRGPRPPATH
ncbi:MAG TPA: AraC family transcriptional regulator [Polyangiaceae bacterium]|nr:AraC family transcriptional regulator [Polyangiaceae bacterium]